MVSPGSQPMRTRLRLRDNIATPGCLDLSRHSSSLLSPSLYPQLALFDHGSLENDFPFQVSPTEPTARTTYHEHQSGPPLADSNTSLKPEEAQSRALITPLGAVTNIASSPGASTAGKDPSKSWQTRVDDHQQPSLQTPAQTRVWSCC